MLRNVIALAALADQVASYVSARAATWPVRLGDQRAIPVQWLAGDAGDHTRQLVEALKARTLAPYRALGRSDAVPVVTEGEREPALAEVVVWGSDGRLEISFPGEGMSLDGTGG